MDSHPPSLRRRFTLWLGVVVVLGAVALRLSYYRMTVATLARDLDVQLWSRLAAVKAQERFAPDTLLDPHVGKAGIFLPDLPGGAREAVPRVFGLALRWLGPPNSTAIAWFAGVWKADGTPLDHLDLPADIRFDPAWSQRLDTLWTTPAGTYRLAATAGARDTLLVAGMPLAGLVAAERRVAWHQVVTFAVWVPLVIGTAWYLLSRGLAPAARLATIAGRIRAGHFDERIDLQHTDTEFREAAAALNAMLDRLETIRVSQSRFNADVAHQVLNPVHAILLETDTPGCNGPRDPRLRRIGKLARRIESLCETLLTYSRSAALDEARLRAVDLEPILAAALDRMLAQAAERGVTLVPPVAGAIVKGDAALLEEAFVNLLGNAVEHSPAGSRVTVTTTLDDKACRVAIIDHGPGVASAELPNLFSRFHSGRPAGGHGIGLALARVIARSHGGDITHTPTPGGGATFTLEIPRNRYDSGCVHEGSLKPW